MFQSLIVIAFSYKYVLIVAQTWQCFNPDE